MRILLISQAAWRGTGYGAPVGPLVREWRAGGDGERERVGLGKGVESGGGPAF